jgi:hypothetical protein
MRLFPVRFRIKPAQQEAMASPHRHRPNIRVTGNLKKEENCMVRHCPAKTRRRRSQLEQRPVAGPYAPDISAIIARRVGAGNPFSPP